jgi:DNA-binding MarR family transcriptional regulator
MDTKEIRAFRHDLRIFARILDQQDQVCCCSEVTPAQCHALLELEESGPLPNGRLAAQLQVDASTLSRTIDQLDQKGLVVRKPHPTDRRATLLKLSDRGGQVATAIHVSADAIYRCVFDNIPEDRRPDVLQGFAQLVEAFVHWQTQTDDRCSL